MRNLLEQQQLVLVRTVILLYSIPWASRQSNLFFRKSFRNKSSSSNRSNLWRSWLSLHFRKCSFLVRRSNFKKVKPSTLKASLWSTSILFKVGSLHSWRLWNWILMMEVKKRIFFEWLVTKIPSICPKSSQRNLYSYTQNVRLVILNWNDLKMLEALLEIVFWL
jgi:hypothetical protein